MNPKASATLEKASEDRRRSNFKKALSRLEEGIEKFPTEMRLYTEAIEVGMEAGESIKAIQLFKKANQKFQDDPFELWTFAVEKVGTYNDPIVGRFLLEQAVRNQDLTAADSVLGKLTDHAAADLLERIRTKKQTMSAALGTGLAARDEMVSYALTEALLCLRTGRLAEAMDGFLRALDDNPPFASSLEPFLLDLERRLGQQGESDFALGCCYIAGTQFSKGFDRFVRAAKTDPAVAPRAIRRIESLGNSPGLPPDESEMALATLHMGQGEHRNAATLFRAVLERNRSKAADIIDILRPAVDAVGEDLDSHFLFVEAAFAAERRETALGQLRKIYQVREHRARLVEWLESRSESQGGATETQLFFAETALNEGLHGKAIEIFKDMLSRGAGEKAMIKELLSKHQSVPLVRQFYSENFSASLGSQGASSFEFERYDGPGFPPRDADTPPEKEPGGEDNPRITSSQPSGDPHIRVDEFSLGGDSHDPQPKDEAVRPEFDNREFSLSMHAASGAPVEAPLQEHDERDTGPANGSDLFEYLKRDFANQETAGGDAQPMSAEDFPSLTGSDEPAPAPDAETAKDQTADDRVEETPETPTIVEDTPEMPEKVEKPAEASEEIEPAALGGSDETVPAAPPMEAQSGTQDDLEGPIDLSQDFDSLHRLYLDGKIGHREALEIADRALSEGRAEDMRKFLSFDPANLGEDIARKYRLARYYLATDRPVAALVALRTVRLSAISKEERKDFLLRIAECYHALHNFEAAHGVYLRIMCEHPQLAEVELMAQSNYERYVQMIAGAAPALEKSTTL